MKKKKVKDKPKGVLFVLLVGFAVISFWRGVWGIQDQYLFPNNPLISLSASIFIGILILMWTNYLEVELI